RAVRKLARGVQRAVGVNVVAAMNEKIWTGLQHGRISAHAPARLVDAPAAAGGIARPHERDGAPFARRRAKTPNLRRTERARKRMILEADAIEHVLPGGQTLEQRLGGEIGFRQS